MRLLFAAFLSLLAQGAAAADAPSFYVVDVRHSGDAVLHASTKSFPPKTELPYVLVDQSAMACCFRLGVQSPGQKPIKIDEDAPPLTSEEGEETFQLSGHVTAAPRAGLRGSADRLGFGFVGMTSVQAKGKRTYEVMLAQFPKPVFVRHCLGAEGVNFRLYHTTGDRKPYASYYFALGYDVKADCP